MPQLITTRELANRLGVSPRTILDAARRGRIPSVRISKRSVRFPADVVERLEIATASPSTDTEGGE